MSVYLNNRNLLVEIHKSKCTFSSFAAPIYSQYDIIADKFTSITAETIELGKKNKAKRIGFETFTAAREAGDKKIKLIDCIPPVESIKDSDVVIRIMTFNHIPSTPKRKKVARTVSDLHERVNFPPFQHWCIEDGKPKCVGKSHWRGDLTNGNFSKDHGRMTEALGSMFITLSKRYAQRGNWRSYTYVDEMMSQAVLQLSQVGLQFDESKSANPFAYYTTTLENSFTRILNVEKKSQDIRDDLLEEAGLIPSMTRQMRHEFADEIARQAQMYKSIKLKFKKTVVEKSNFTDLFDTEAADTTA